MSVRINGTTQVGSHIKASSTCRWLLDNGWSYDGIRWGVKPGHHAKLVKIASSGGYKVIEMPDEDETNDSKRVE